MFTTLLGEDFKAKLQKAVRWVEDGDGFATEAIIADIDTVVGTLGRLYEVRHIVTHELPSGQTYDPAELDRFINSVEQFLEACEAVVDSRLWYSDAENVEQLHAYLDGDIEEWTAALSSTLHALERRDGTDAALLRESQKIWLSFANAHTELASRYHQDWWKHVAYKLAMKTLLQERWVQLQQFPETIPIHK